ncbi:MAG TPA: hypothetical protein VLS89_05990, partial [Candidatus Nanopelagicales bacterium]|nr:hypothetical protein [Candidatus Nanopelagicales bacterium]
DREATIAARRFGADGVCVDALLPAGEWDRVAKGARAMRMLALALARDEAGVKAAVQAGARAILLRAESVEAAREAARAAPRGVIVVAEVAGADADGLRALVGQVDAAVVPAEVHRAPGFAALAADLDP